MPRPRPLTNLASARPDPDSYQLLTPRTPRTRSGRAEEGYTEFELQQLEASENDDDYGTEAQHQSAPLLRSSASDSFPATGYRNRSDSLGGGNKRPGMLDVETVISRLPLVLGMLLVGFLFILVVFSFERPERLHKYFGAKPSNEMNPIPSGMPKNHDTSPNVLSYENYTKFPLLPSEYRAECSKLNQGYMAHGEFWEPHDMGVLDVEHHDDNHNYRLPEGQRTAVCTSTITYMLDGKVGLLADLALMAQAAALAREQNRTFMIDDTYWNRGKWTDHFQDVRKRQIGPERGCRAPPPEELVACPRLARHWVINSRTAKYHFGHGFSNQYENAYAHQLNRVKPIYVMGLESLQETIRPNAKVAALIREARSELSTISPNYISVHIRRGDRKPASYSYNGYVPMGDFIKAVTSTWRRIKSSKQKGTTVYVASDDPSARREFSDLSEYKTFSLSQSKDPQLRALASPGEYVQKDFDNLDEDTRIRATRGMIVDFALLSGLWAWKADVTPAATVCTISSNVCKLSAIGLGWRKAFGEVDDMGYLDEKGKRWIEIDQKGQVVPVWEPFELFN